MCWNIIPIPQVITLKVLFVIDGLGQGGAERSLAEMLPALVRAGIRPTVAFFHRHATNLEEHLRAEGAELCFLPEQGTLGRVRSLRRLIRSRRPDVIHTALFTSDLIGRLASVGQRATVISSLVNTSYDRIRLQNADINPLKLWLVRLLDAWTARYLTTHFHAVSEPVKNAAIESLGLPAERITVVERGRSNRFAGPSAERRRLMRRRLGLNESDDVIISVGRQEYQKGQRYLVEAMEDLARRRPSAVLLVAGGAGRHTRLLESIQRERGLSQHVRMLGHRDDVPDLLAGADLFVLPSLYEGAAGALLEAMAMGLPIVATRIPAIENIVEDGRNALLVERQAAAPLAAAMATLLADREQAAAFGRRSREIFEERFTLDRSATAMVEFYWRLQHAAH